MSSKIKNIIQKLLQASLCIIASSVSLFSFSQDIHFSQFFQAPLLRNPALAGIFTGDIRVQSIYRDQWNTVTDAYKTASIEGEYKTHIGKSNDYITTGLQFLYDKAGTISWSSTYVLPAVNYHKSLSTEKNSYLSLAFMGGFVQHRIDRSKMTTNSTYNNGTDGETFNSPQYTYLDGSIGMSYNANLNNNVDNNYFVGVAYHHFNSAKVSFYQDPKMKLFPKWVFSGGIKFGVSDISYITIQADHSMQGGFNETIGGAMYGLKLGDIENPPYTIHAGTFLRWNDALIPTLKLDYNPFSVAVSYDVNISKLKPSSYGRGGFEISISFIGSRKTNASIESVLCPRF